MSLPIVFACRSTHSERSRAAFNLCALMSELAVPHLVLLDSLGVEIEFDRRKPSDRGVHSGGQSIKLNLNDFGQFTYGRGRKRTATQRRALARLMQETIHALDAHFRFTSQRNWKKAAKAELRVPNVRRYDLIAAQRQHDCYEEAQRERHGYRSILEKLTELIDPAVAPGGRLLVDLLLVREHLRRSMASRSEVDRVMQDAFPNTYPLASQFDSLVEREAAQSAIRRHPEMASEPILAMQRAFREVQVLRQPDTSIDIEEGAKSHRPR